MVTDLLGWDLDPDKADVGSCVVVLGVEITLDGEDSFWRLSPMKRQRWIDDLKTVLADDKLTPGHASKLCGRLAFLNSRGSNKIGRGLLRPLVWRQSCARRDVTLTPRLWFALKWFLAVLDQACSRRINLGLRILPPVVLIYSDAEQNGHIGAVAEFPSGQMYYLQGHLPWKIKRLFRRRKTNIVAYDLLAALVAIVSVCPSWLWHMRVQHFIDSTSALACVVRVFSSKTDLSLIAGRLWFETCAMQVDYRAEYVSTKQNLADGPSRCDRSLMETLDATEIIDWQWPVFGGDLASWLLSSPSLAEHVVLHSR